VVDVQKEREREGVREGVREREGERERERFFTMDSYLMRAT
jgi:hypothetical protein